MQREFYLNESLIVEISNESSTMIACTHVSKATSLPGPISLVRDKVDVRLTTVITPSTLMLSSTRLLILLTSLTESSITIEVAPYPSPSVKVENPMTPFSKWSKFPLIFSLTLIFLNVETLSCFVSVLTQKVRIRKGPMSSQWIVKKCLSSGSAQYFLKTCTFDFMR